VVVEESEPLVGTEVPCPLRTSRNFAAAGPDRLWVADITYVKTDEGFLYLSFILNSYSRRLVGLAMEPTGEQSR
jgi:transposase InsO family protein